jgi:hypothetical protein
MVARTAITWQYMENVKSFFPKNKNSTYNEKNSEDSSHQAFTYFSFSEFLSSDFRQNKWRAPNELTPSVGASSQHKQKNLETSLLEILLLSQFNAFTAIFLNFRHLK